MGEYTITVLGGDGVGPEVTQQATHVLKTVEQLYKHTFHLHERLVGVAAIEAEGSAISEETLLACQQSDAILFGAIGSKPGPNNRPPQSKPEYALFRLRKDFAFFANIRPVCPFPSLLNASTLKPQYLQGTDLVIVRELTAGLYYGYHDSTPRKPSEIRTTAEGEEAIDTLLYTSNEIERIVRAGFDIARERRKKVTSVDKSNVLSSSVLWRKIVNRISAEYPDVAYEHMLVDSCAMHLLRKPADFDVIVTENLFGDILSDEASMLTGSIGMLPSASLGTRKSQFGTFGLYEPIHGSAPDIAGKDKVNPIAAILSAALLLRYSLGLKAEAYAVEKAVEAVLNAGYRTEDLTEEGTKVLGTRAMGEQIAHALLQL